ncbi:MAG: hypothetical protein K8S00_02210 [Bacteroidales bacterium]|nr:hypothetical protein [Bacteroidales bacterium]
MKKEQDIFKLLRTQDWEKIILILIEYVETQLKLSQLLNEKKTRGIEAKDLVMEAIYKVISREWKWDPDKADLLTYLKFHVIRGLLSNLIHSKEFLSTSEYNIDSLQNIFFSEIVTDSKLNLAEVVKLMRQTVEKDIVESSILDGIIIGLKKNEICAKYNISFQDYKNAYKRMKRKLLNADYINILKEN